jgi:hypothetical protein
MAFLALPVLSANPVIGQPSTQFQEIKKVAATQLSARTYDQVFFSENGVSDLYSCGGGAMALGLSESDSLSGSSRYFQLADVAAWSVLLEKKLNTAGLANVAAPYITSMEQLTARIDTSGGSTNFDRYSKEKENLLRKLADQLNKAAADKGIRGLRFTVEGGCGAGELLYRVAVTPPSAKVHIIKTFYYMLCQARGGRSPRPPELLWVAGCVERAVGGCWRV